MRNKKAKELRRLARKIGAQMELPEEDIITEELPPKMQVTSNGSFVEVERTQRHHSKNSQKGWYRALKKGAN